MTRILLALLLVVMLAGCNSQPTGRRIDHWQPVVDQAWLQ